MLMNYLCLCVKQKTAYEMRISDWSSDVCSSDLNAPMEIRSEQACFGGTMGFYSHASTSTGTQMRFAVFMPPQARSAPVPALYFLAGLTCTEDTFMKIGNTSFRDRVGQYVSISGVAVSLKKKTIKKVKLQL